MSNTNINNNITENEFMTPTDEEIFRAVNNCIKYKDETELHEYIEKNDFFKKYCKWSAVGGNTDNFKFLYNQQSDPLRALCEPIVNSMDQLLLLECLKEGSDPRDVKNPNIPKSMHQAAEKYYGTNKGRLIYTDKNKIKKLAHKIKLTVLDAKNNQDQIIYLYDEATGQHPKDFKDTFLYHLPSEKNAIPFVQGQYGMGNGGAFSFSGNHKYVMILSCRHPALVEDNVKDKRKWGFTIIRKNISNDYNKISYFEFLCDKNDQILSFNKNEIPNTLPGIVEGKNNYKNVRLVNSMRYGTLIKYFNYQNRTEKSARHILRKLNLYLWDLPLPCSLYVDRKKSKETHMERYISGRARFSNSRLIHPKHDEGINFTFSTTHIIDNKRIELRYRGQAYLFKQYVKIAKGPEKGNYKNTANELITEFGTVRGVLTVNGQAHGTLDGTFFQNFKLKSLKKYIFLAVDFTDVIRKHRLIEDAFFMPNREKIRKSPYMTEFKEELRKTLESHPILKKTNIDYQNEADKRILSNSEIKIDFLKILKKERPEILEIFNGQLIDIEKNNKIEEENKTSDSFDVVDNEIQLELVEKFGYNDKEIRGIKFKTTNERIISRTVRCGQERIYVHCVSEYPLDDIDVIQINGKNWKKMPSKLMTKNNLQITLFPSGDEELNDKIKVIIHKISKKHPEAPPKTQSAKLKSEITSTHQNYFVGKYGHEDTHINNKQSLINLNGSFIEEDASSSTELKDSLCINLIFKDLKISKSTKKQEKPKKELFLPELIPITSKDPYWKEYEIDDEFITRPNDNEDKIIISIENKDFLNKFNNINEGKKKKFKNDYLMHIYLTVLYFLCQLKKENLDTDNFNAGDTLKMLRSAQQAWLHSWKN